MYKVVFVSIFVCDMNESNQQLKFFSDISDQEIFFVKKGSLDFLFDANKFVLPAIGKDDLQRVFRLANLGNYVLIRGAGKVMIELPINLETHILLLPNEYIQRDFSDKSQSDVHSIADAGQLAELVFSLYTQKKPPTRQVMVYWLEQKQFVEQVENLNFKKDSKESLFFFYQEQIANNLQALDQKNIIKNMNELKSLFPNYQHQKNQLIVPADQSYLKELLISFICSMADHSIDSGLSLNESAKIRMELINRVYQQQIVNFYSEIKKIVWAYFDKLKNHNREDGAGVAFICRNYIDGNLEKKLTLHEIAEKGNVSKQTLNPIFKKRYGVTVKQYVNNKKIELAKKMLADNKKNLQEISNYLSFVDKSYFVKIFHSITGVTPKKYRHELFDKK
ncbi:helix-turn-helix domain-containing protein [Oenococcus oeni]|uniref:helix-turn-helix domain-containing protein n=2 Tax=Oenococcus oeni TaxID=1247 RepID=UPI000277B8F8|nr:helix-turn-helix domain-containing protein [Oenococcus oeni]KGH56236.1 AraC family transcriptional regulator [Oenococcus oeni S22]KGH58569.1 AraC family transcriptional regulator [Oenococcus oeni IOEB_9805]KGH62226.1 AraC family transcriptional regulator [Oenococcus oeni S13]KGH70212.1 AraC family transcriptional regulator [Oenococcus oeni S25]KGH75315.1 AraC family transcriptional regulator [Oenococcus oeni IOEB_9304]KGH76974.1 AraC family transcriptional regulator [Oenococcus oeni IOEB_8